MNRPTTRLHQGRAQHLHALIDEDFRWIFPRLPFFIHRHFPHHLGWTIFAFFCLVTKVMPDCFECRIGDDFRHILGHDRRIGRALGCANFRHGQIIARVAHRVHEIGAISLNRTFVPLSIRDLALARLGSKEIVERWARLDRVIAFCHCMTLSTAPDMKCLTALCHQIDRFSSAPSSPQQYQQKRSQFHWRRLSRNTATSKKYYAIR